MRHRHLDTSAWTLVAIDSALEYGTPQDWRELFAAVRADRELGWNVIGVAEAHPVEGASALAKALVASLWPDLAACDARAR